MDIFGIAHGQVVRPEVSMRQGSVCDTLNLHVGESFAHESLLYAGSMLCCGARNGEIRLNGATMSFGGKHSNDTPSVLRELKSAL